MEKAITMNFTRKKWGGLMKATMFALTAVCLA